MKVELKNIFSIAVLGMTLVATIIPTWAGKVLTPEVFIYTNRLGASASGSLMGARYSADGTQNIGCTVYGLSSQSWTTCLATDKARNYLVCGSSDPRWAEVVQSMTDSSYVYFATAQSYGDCSDIRIYDGSDVLK